MKVLHERLIEQAKQGQENAMNNIYSLYSKAMLNTSFRIVNNLEDAEDVLQESFLNAFSKLNQFQNQSTFGAWLKRIVVNKSIDCIKKKQRHGSFVELNESIISDEHSKIQWFENSAIDKQEKLDRIYQALHLLPTGYRTVFSLYLLEGYDHEEIAGILSISVSTSISQLSRAKKKLAALVENNL